MNQTALLFATLALLAAPGPTNTILSLAAAQHGWRRAAPLIGVALGAYICAILTFGAGREYLLAALPSAANWLRLIAALWVAALAARLWRAPSLDAGYPPITASQVGLTTLFNPKGMVIAFGLLPSTRDAAYPVAIAFAAVAILASAAAWTALGALASLAPQTHSRQLGLRRLAAGWLGLVAGGLIASLAAPALALA